MKSSSLKLNELAGKTGGSRNKSREPLFFAMEWKQLEFNFSVQKKKRKAVDYQMLYEHLKQGPLTFNDIERLTGVPHCSVAQIITTLSLNYPLWSPSRGVYKLMEESDYQ